MEDALGDELFDDYVERQPRCRAVTVRIENIYKIAQWLNNQGFHTKVDADNSKCTLEIISNKESLFVVDAGERDAIQWAGPGNINRIPGAEFRRIWEKET